jgi:hypothetical protein
VGGAGGGAGGAAGEAGGTSGAAGGVRPNGAGSESGDAGVTLVKPSGLPRSAAAGMPGNEPVGASRGGGLGSLALASFSAASRFSRSSRALASRSAASLSALSFCAFCPPLSLTIEPICGVCPRVSSSAVSPGWYCRPGLADGKAPLAVTCRSAPGRAVADVVAPSPPNQPQPLSNAKVDTPSKRSPRPLLLTSSPSLRMPPNPRSKPSPYCLAEAESKIDPSVVAAYLRGGTGSLGTADTRYGTGMPKLSQETLQSQ